MADPTAAGAAPRVRALILAAGAGTRFGGGKLAARVDGKAVLGHVIDAVRDAGLGRPAVVLGPSDPAGVDLGGTTIVRNPEPARGLASSLRIGWRTAADSWPLEPAPDAVLVVLGDQPLVRPETLRALASVPLDHDRPIVAARHRGSTAPNPVRIDVRGGAELVERVSGDRGLGPVIDGLGEAVRWVDVDGDNPDIDSAPDLAHVADLAWARRVRANREQVDRVRELPDGADFYEKVSSVFREDPDRTGDPVRDALVARVRPGDTWLDIGAGAGRYALPLARRARRVIALDPSPSMLSALREAAEEHGIDNVDPIEGRWPQAADPALGVLAGRLPVDASLIAHVGYDIEAVWTFLDAMERATRRECLAVMMERSPATLAEPFWPEVHGERRISLAGLPAFVDLLTAHGRAPTVRMLESRRRRWASRDELETNIRRQTWVAPGTAKDRRMQELMDEWLVIGDDGKVDLRNAEPLTVGLVAWEPG